MDTCWLTGVKNLKTYGRWAFTEFTQIFRIEADHKAKVESNLDKMIKKCSRRM